MLQFDSSECAIICLLPLLSRSDSENENGPSWLPVVFVGGGNTCLTYVFMTSKQRQQRHTFPLEVGDLWRASAPYGVAININTVLFDGTIFPDIVGWLREKCTVEFWNIFIVERLRVAAAGCNTIHPIMPKNSQQHSWLMFALLQLLPRLSTFCRASKKPEINAEWLVFYSAISLLNISKFVTHFSVIFECERRTVGPFWKITVKNIFATFLTF